MSMTIYLDRPVSREPGSADDRPLSRAQLRRALENDRRRSVLRTILEADEPIALGTLAGQLADDEKDATFVTTLLELRQRVYVALRQTHLPLLESCGLVVYDRERGLVSPGRELAALESLLSGDDGTVEDVVASTFR
ncbi:DUF7344 domain-containing protein [Natronobacterium texcoconense]|uniref:DUF7344 domain-containing protein n=1 Tax=Natronobacterium texcoconense TaxID=1095778 RepID=A0A1H1I289_NATTX|nr:hypothetical protein SAMN04489842_3255 [Natronobacterium texcoconense]